MMKRTSKGRLNIRIEPVLEISSHRPKKCSRPPASYSRVVMDTSVLIAYIRSKDDGSLSKATVTKALTEDTLMITDLIWAECLKYHLKKSHKVTYEDIERALRDLDVKVFYTDPMSEEELEARYDIEDGNDRKILYSVDTTKSTIFVTYDDDFFRRVNGVEAAVMDPFMYLHRDDWLAGKIPTPRDPRRLNYKIIHKRKEGKDE